ncbi:ABC transporter G family member 4 isoform X1 [Physcomitrium patens]|uniref:ABC transporter domain-containing protein n=2 Tax=Physcomitrium patens TaxID=3218 RepID=A0A2K1KJY9_PHYPA|nr:ABC transporter G family member 4-like isoform X1 [Physcomitrium patens]PNR54089.1 hypothetical protein PHYPA_007765 [Physcomitrium patens]|eukprot:XP_024375901.1 ABC transporter G family member 4-like isoform X1 [Physcomitrella patens]
MDHNNALTNQMESTGGEVTNLTSACFIKACCHGHLYSINKHGIVTTRTFPSQKVSKIHYDFSYPEWKISELAVEAALKSTTPPLSRTKSYEIELRDMSYKITKPRKSASPGWWGCCGNKHDDSIEKIDSSKYVLNRINMKARPGEILGVAGPSGAGKSTLLEVLACELRPSSRPSSMLVNQQQMERQQFRRISGYVMQDDALFPMLTVEETLMYSARLRISSYISMAEKKLRVQSTMEELGLLHVAKSRVGNDNFRGLSGGERRRVSIGVDVIHDPAVLILDEPTSGLDSGSALHVVSMLSRMAISHNRTIILSIHQPSYRILELLNSILLLAGGKVIHHGPLDLLSVRLAASGHTIPEQSNPLEYAIDIIDQLDEDCNCCTFENPATARPPGNTELQHYGSSDLDSAHVLLPKSTKLCTNPSDISFANSSWQEIAVLVHRFFINVYRTKQLLKARTLHSLIGGICLGSVYANMGHGTRGMSERYGLLAFIVTLLLSSSIEVLPCFLEECRIMSRETSRGAYRMMSYIVANTLIFLPFLLFNAVLFSAPLYWLVGLAPQPFAFLFFILTIWVLLVTAYSFVALFSAIVPNYQLGYTIVMGLLGAFFLYSGFFISRDNLPKYWLWAHYLSLYKYPLEALLINEYSHVSDKCFSDLYGAGQCSLTGSQVLEQGGLQGSADNKWTNLGIMAGFVILYRFLCFVVLRLKMGCRRR